MGAAVNFVLTPVQVDGIMSERKVNICVARRTDTAYSFGLGHVLINRHQTSYASLNLGFINDIGFVYAGLNRLRDSYIIYHYSHRAVICFVL